MKEELVTLEMKIENLTEEETVIMVEKIKEILKKYKVDGTIYNTLKKED